MDKLLGRNPLLVLASLVALFGLSLPRRHARFGAPHKRGPPFLLAGWFVASCSDAVRRARGGACLVFADALRRYGSTLGGTATTATVLTTLWTWLPVDGAASGAHFHRVNVPWSMAAHEDGTVKSGDELQAIYTGAGLDEGESTVGYCRIGERSSRTWFVLHEFAGLSGVKLLDRVRFIGRCADRVGAAKAYRHVWAPEQTQHAPLGTDLRKSTVLTGRARTVVSPSTVPSCGYSMAPGSSPLRWCSRPRTRSSFSQLRVSDCPCTAPIRHRRPWSPANGPGLFPVDAAVS
jgi:hypothetical protein